MKKEKINFKTDLNNFEKQLKETIRWFEYKL